MLDANYFIGDNYLNKKGFISEPSDNSKGYLFVYFQFTVHTTPYNTCTLEKFIPTKNVPSVF